MTPLRRFASLVLSEVLLVSLAACSGAAPPPPRSPSPTDMALPSVASTSSAQPSAAPADPALPPAAPADPAQPPAAPADPAQPPAAPADPSTIRWKPPAHVTWQWQLTGPLDLSVNAQVYDVDLFSTSAEQVQQLRAQGRKVICYLDAGSHEPDRPDSAQYPVAILGRELSGWPGERWLDIRRLDVLIPLIAARMDLCAKKGFDGVEPDNVDGYQNNTGFNGSIVPAQSSAASRIYSSVTAFSSGVWSISNNVDFFRRLLRMTSRSGKCATRFKPACSL